MRILTVRFNLSAISALFVFLLASVMAFSAGFDTEPLTIHTEKGKSHLFTVELAVEANQRSQGLMDRDEMAADHGMLFDFGESRQVYMWMKNTYLPLDMLFIKQDGTIALIREDTLPLSEAIVDSHDPVRFVLELNGGTSSRLGIKAGDRVESSRVKAATLKP